MSRNIHALAGFLFKEPIATLLKSLALIILFMWSGPMLSDKLWKGVSWVMSSRRFITFSASNFNTYFSKNISNKKITL
jgi:hypothetical protein